MSKVPGSRRRTTRKRRESGNIKQLPWRQLEYHTAATQLLSADHVESIHQTALKALEEIGIDVLCPKARQNYQEAGFSVNKDSMRVRFDSRGIESYLSSVPAEFVLHARNAAKNIKIGGQNFAFASLGGAAYCMDIDTGRRGGTLKDVCDWLRLVQSLDIVHQEGGGGFEALDLPPETRHLDLYHAQIQLMDKNWQPWGVGHQQAIDAINMAAIMLGKKTHELIDTPVFSCVINTNSPFQLDIPMAEGLTTMAEHGQACIITPFTLAGAMSPVTLAGALTQQHAEAMAAIVLTQIVRKGAPVIYGGFTSNVDMRTGSPAFGTPEYTQAAQASAQLARRLNIPFRSSNVTAANSADAQAAYESMMSLWGAINGQANLIMHAAGWMGGGLTASFEKLIIDAEMLQMMTAYTQPFEVNDASMALEAMREVGPAGHFFGSDHTMARYENAFYTPILSNWDNFETWQEKGQRDAQKSANLIWKQLLTEYQQPDLDQSIDEELGDYVARRKLGI